MRTWASVLGHNDIVGILEETLEEEKETDQKLTQLAENFVNEAAAEDEDEEVDARRGGMRGRREMQGRGRTSGRAAAADRGGRRRR